MSSSFLVLGDLHYDPINSIDFERAAQQLQSYNFDNIFQLGDVGGYHYPGTKASYEDALKFFNSLKHPVQTLMGNHDLEGREFNTDLDNLQAWLQTFQQSSPWRCIDIGDHLGILLSTTSFRKHPVCSHQVMLGEEQYQWLQETLINNKDRMTFIFCHVPIISSGLTTLLSPHLSAPNAFLDQTEDPFKYDQLLQANPQIRLWFSGHNHLGQQYQNSITQRHQCTFIHTGTMSAFTRDGQRQSRLIKIHSESIEIHTIDHNKEISFIDATLNLENTELTHHQPLLKEALGKFHFTPNFDSNKEHWSIAESLLQWHHHHLVEYDNETTWPLGVVYRGPESPTRCDEQSIYLQTEVGERRFPLTNRKRFYRPHMPSSSYIDSGAPLAVK